MASDGRCIWQSAQPSHSNATFWEADQPERSYRSHEAIKIHVEVLLPKHVHCSLKQHKCAGFLIFLWALIILSITLAANVGLGLLAWMAGSYLWRRLHYWDRMVRLTQLYWVAP